MANIKLDSGPSRPLRPLWACVLVGLLLFGVITPWATFAALLFGLVFLGEAIGRLGE